MTRATRRLIVAHLTTHGMTAAEIADELGVSRETVRRDLHNPPPSAAPEPAPDVAFGEQVLSLPPSTQLRQDLRLLADSYKAPAEDVAQQLLHREAEAIRDRMRARFAARNGQARANA
ncbi:HTH domain-containing protein [Streptomyces sp. NPDC002838]|uniref:HTH domain-containing protein n=1 Tax=Streptomyces sp. NPDC002838 TaxID=3154436 RepID=UPI003333F6E7